MGKNARHRGAENVKNAGHRGASESVRHLSSCLCNLSCGINIAAAAVALHDAPTLHCYIADPTIHTLYYIATLLYQQTIHTLEDSLHFATSHCTKVLHCIPHIPEL